MKNMDLCVQIVCFTDLQIWSTVVVRSVVRELPGHSLLFQSPLDHEESGTSNSCNNNLKYFQK